MVLDPWQNLVLDVGMGERADGSWAADEVAVICSRQHGKNVCVEVRELYGLVILGEWIIHTAHEFKTTRKSFNRLLGLIEADRDIADRLVSKLASPASGYELRFRGGGQIAFIARSRSSGRGFTGDLLVEDEAQELTDEQHGALLPTLSARLNTQTWSLGSAPPRTGEVLQRTRKRGRAGGESRLAFLEWSAEPGVDPLRPLAGIDLDSRAAWAQGNPGLGFRMTAEKIEGERRSMSDETFARERLSISPEIVEAGPKSVVLPKWGQLVDIESSADPAAFAVDVSPDRRSASISVAGLRADGLFHVELIDRREGSEWVTARMVELAEKWRPGCVVLDKIGPAARGGLPAELDEAGIEVTWADSGDVAAAWGLTFDLVEREELRHLDQSELNDAVEGACERNLTDAKALDRRHSDADITPLVSVTLALWGLHRDLPVGDPLEQLFT